MTQVIGSSTVALHRKVVGLVNRKLPEMLVQGGGVLDAAIPYGTHNKMLLDIVGILEQLIHIRLAVANRDHWFRGGQCTIQPL